MNIPNDPVILLSYINTQLRDFYPSLDELCKSMGLKAQDLSDKLDTIGYQYDKDRNQFI